MTTYFPFTPKISPTAAAPFTFSPTLDGAPYTGVITANVFGRRYYVSLYAANGQRVLTLPMIESPAGVAIQAITWTLGKVTVVTANPHGYAMGQTINLTVSQCAPDAYNGGIVAFITSPNSFTYLLGDNPGDATAVGIATYDINLAGGYFTTSTLVFRNQQFEVSP